MCTDVCAGMCVVPNTCVSTQRMRACVRTHLLIECRAAQRQRRRLGIELIPLAAHLTSAGVRACVRACARAVSE